MCVFVYVCICVFVCLCICVFVYLYLYFWNCVSVSQVPHHLKQTGTQFVYLHLEFCEGDTHDFFPQQAPLGIAHLSYFGDFVNVLYLQGI